MRYERPSSSEQALDLMRQPGAHALGGGTDLLVSIREGLVHPELVVDLRSLPGFGEIRWQSDGSVLIGAGVGLATLAADDVMRRQFAALATSCAAVGSPALRNMGTLGGNLCQRPRCWYFRSGVACFKSGGSDCPAIDGANQHLAILGGGPCHAIHPSDPAVALTALEARIHLDGPAGPHTRDIADFFAPPSVDPTRETRLAPGEIVVAVEVPAASAGGQQRFSKILQRGAWDFSLASIAVVRRQDGGVRLVLGGVAPGPWRVNTSIEEDVAAGELSADDLDALAERALYDAQPLSRNGYKVNLVKALLREAMALAAAP
ncbi:MAG TPA: FAD binding domain-containing protein [Gemmatimonadaceae bacterium]